jgi:cyanophycin synthetase
MAVLETARGGILRRGLGYDWSDVAVVTNITRDHIGQDGIETLDDVIWIKSLVAERVKDGGTLVLNADDPGAASLATDARVMRGGDGAGVPSGNGPSAGMTIDDRGTTATSDTRLNLVYIALAPSNPVVQRHLAAGGTAYYVDDGVMIEARGTLEVALVELVDVPATLGGTAEYQVANCLAAAAASRALGLSPEEVAVGLASFDPDLHNPGRSTIFGLGAGHVMVDYGHNPEAFKATGRLVASWPGERIGIVGVPGDRNDDSIADAARAAAEAYPRLLLREDDDLRGRRPGEVTGMMLDAIRAADPSVKVEVVDDALMALQRLLPEVAAGAFVIIYYEHLEPVVALLTEAGAEPTAVPAGLLSARQPRTRGATPRRSLPGTSSEPGRLAHAARYSALSSSSSESR